MTQPPSGPEIDFANLGPGLGERFPDVTLKDQTRHLVDLHGDRAGREAVVLFHRSARW